jgi:hypothetical protein
MEPALTNVENVYLYRKLSDIHAAKLLLVVSADNLAALMKRFLKSVILNWFYFNRVISMQSSLWRMSTIEPIGEKAQMFFVSFIQTMCLNL